MRNKSYLILVLMMLATLTPAWAEIYSYVDTDRIKWYVNDPADIPEQYREGSRTANLPEINSAKPEPRKAQPAGLSTSSASAQRSEKKVEVFVTDWCPYCVKLEKYLKANNIDYTRYNIETNAAGKSKYKKLGGGGIPITTIDGQVVKGYDPGRISNLLR